jgi:hypothetical protein
MDETMQAITAITNVLIAMGANPETVTRPNGETVIKINAPVINNDQESETKCNG